MIPRALLSSAFTEVDEKPIPVAGDTVLIGNSEGSFEPVRTPLDALNEVGSQQQFAVSGTAVLIPPSGTIAPNGTTTLAIALPQTYDMGLWVYLPAGAITSVGGGAEGLYWAVASTTQILQFKNNYVDPDAAEFIPRSPATVGSNATGSDSAYATVDSTNLTMANLTIPADSMGLNGRVDVDVHFSQISSGNAMRNMVQISDNDLTRLNSSANLSARHISFFQNMGVASKQVAGADSSVVAGKTDPALRFSEDTTADIQLTCKGWMHSGELATGYVLLDSLKFEITTA